MNNLESLPPGPRVNARIVPGHQVASGKNGNPKFPGGTLHMQSAHFAALGLDLSGFYKGTINVAIAPLRYRVVRAPLTFRQVKWHASEPPEDFSFFDVCLLRPNSQPVVGKIYYPHPDTKPTHFQQPDVLELLLPYVQGLVYGEEVQLRVPAVQMVFEDDRR
jgi:hypothetical protein